MQEDQTEGRRQNRRNNNNKRPRQEEEYVLKGENPQPETTDVVEADQQEKVQEAQDGGEIKQKKPRRERNKNKDGKSPKENNEKQEKKDKRDNRGYRDNRNNRGYKSQGGDKTEEAEKEPTRKVVRFTPPEDWKEQAEKLVTIDYKIPALPEDNEYLLKPSYNKLMDDLNYYEDEIEKQYVEIDYIKDEQKRVRYEQRNKNATVYDELKKLNSERSGYSAILGENKKMKSQYMDKINHIDDQLKSIEKKQFSGKFTKKKELLELIRQKEEEFKNSKKTSMEEKKMNDDITRLKVMIKTLPELDSLHEEKKKIYELMREVGEISKVEYEKLKKVNEQIAEAKLKLEENDQKTKQDKEKEKEEAEEEGKKKHVPSAQEQELEAKKQVHYDNIKNLKEEIQKTREKYDNDWFAYDKQNFEVDNIYFMEKIQKKLKWEEREKKWKEEDEKKRAYEAVKAKEMLQFKYQAEIDLCESLAATLEDLKPNKKEHKIVWDQKEVIQHNVNQDELKKEGLLYVKPRKFDEVVDSQVNKKKNKPQKSKKKEVPIENIENEKVSIHFDTLHLFNEIKVAPPTTLGQLDSVISQLNEKKEYYLKLREEDIAKGLSGKHARHEHKHRDEERDNRDQTKDDKHSRKQKNADLKETDFPDL